MTRRAGPRRHIGGLTLIELMVALAIFAVLGVLSYRGLAEVSHSQARLEEGFERWRAIGRCVQRIDTDLLQAVAPGATLVPGNVARIAAMVLGRSADGGGPELQFLRLDDTRGLRRVAYRLRDGRLEWLRWNGREAIGEPIVEPLLDNVRKVTWSFLYNNGRLAAWPPADGRVALPDGLVLELELPDQGIITRVISLR